MADTYFIMRAANFVPQALFNLLLGHVKDIFMVVLSSLPLSNKAFSDKYTNEYSTAEYHPSPLLVPVPIRCIVGAIKERLPLLKYSCVPGRIGGDKVLDSVCVVCLERMEASDEVRELCNCCHVFHRVCLDAWIDQGQVTCPMCRVKLLPSQEEDGLKCGGDSWRRERMFYLFGDDFLMGTC